MPSVFLQSQVLLRENGLRQRLRMPLKRAVVMPGANIQLFDLVVADGIAGDGLEPFLFHFMELLVVG